MQQVLIFLGNILNLLKYPCVIKVSSYLWVYSGIYGHRDDYQSHSVTERERHRSSGDDCYYKNLMEWVDNISVNDEISMEKPPIYHFD